MLKVFFPGVLILDDALNDFGGDDCVAILAFLKKGTGDWVFAFVYYHSLQVRVHAFLTKSMLAIVDRN